LVIAVDTIRLEKNRNESLELKIGKENSQIEAVTNEFLELQKTVALKDEEIAKLREQLSAQPEKTLNEQLKKEVSQLQVALRVLEEAKTKKLDERVERMGGGGGEDSKKRVRELESEVETKRVKITELETAQAKSEKHIKTLKKTISALTEVADDD
jgi:chromosome segregation ATPase